MNTSESSRPFERARTELAYGEFLRRHRRRVDAREHLRPALETFVALEAKQWAERARAELRASGENARSRRADGEARLTPQEFQIARFVAQGLSNREVAAQLFLSPRTVDFHLRNVFTKLGVASRTELATLQLDAHAPTRPASAAEAPPGKKPGDSPGATDGLAARTFCERLVQKLPSRPRRPTVTISSSDLFPTETAGLPAARPPEWLELADGDALDLRIGPVAKQLGESTVRMLAYNGSVPGPVLHVQQGSTLIVNVVNEGDLEATVHWHGLRLDNRFDGTHETQAPMPIGGRLHLPDRVPRPRRLLVPPAHPRGLRPGDGAVREHRRRSGRPRLLVARPPRDRARARRRPDRGRAHRALQHDRVELRRHGPLRQRPAPQRRTRSRRWTRSREKSCAST